MCHHAQGIDGLIQTTWRLPAVGQTWYTLMLKWPPPPEPKPITETMKLWQRKDKIEDLFVVQPLTRLHPWAVGTAYGVLGASATASPGPHPLWTCHCCWGIVAWLRLSQTYHWFITFVYHLSSLAACWETPLQCTQLLQHCRWTLLKASCLTNLALTKNLEVTLFSYLHSGS